MGVSPTDTRTKHAGNASLRIDKAGLSTTVAEVLDRWPSAGLAAGVSGFGSAIVLAPDDGIGVFALSNTGDLSGRCPPAALATALLRRVLGLPDQAIRTGIPPRP